MSRFNPANDRLVRGSNSVIVTSDNISLATSILTGKFTSAFNANSGAMGFHINKPSTQSSPHVVSFDIDNVPKWEVGMDYENVEFVLAYDHSIPGDVIRLAPGPKLVIGPGLGSSALYNNNLVVRGNTSYPILIEPHSVANNTGGIAVKSRGNVAALYATQLAAGSRRVLLDLGDTKGFKIGVDSAQNDTQDFWIYDNVAAAFRLFLNTAGYMGIGTVDPKSKLHVVGGILVGGDPTATASTVGIGNTVGVGDGASTNLTTPAKGTGSGPTTLAVSTWIRATVGTTVGWIPFFCIGGVVNGT